MPGLPNGSEKNVHMLFYAEIYWWIVAFINFGIMFTRVLLSVSGAEAVPGVYRMNSNTRCGGAQITSTPLSFYG